MLELISIIDKAKIKLAAEFEVMEARKVRKARAVPKLEKASLLTAIMMADLLAAFFL